MKSETHLWRHLMEKTNARREDHHKWTIRILMLQLHTLNCKYAKQLEIHNRVFTSLEACQYALSQYYECTIQLWKQKLRFIGKNQHIMYCLFTELKDGLSYIGMNKNIKSLLFLMLLLGIQLQMNGKEHGTGQLTYLDLQSHRKR